MAIQQDPSKSFGSTSYFQNKDEQRRVVNDMRREQRNKRIAQQGLTRNIKRAIRKGENPNAYIDAAKQMGLDPLGGGGLGPEAAQRDAALRAKAASLFEEASQLRKKSDSTVNKQGVTTSSGGTVGKQGVATPSGGIVSESPAINPANVDAASAQPAEPVATGVISNKPKEPEWFTGDVKKDTTFNGVDLTHSRFIGKTREEARQMIMSQKAANDMRYFDSIGKANAKTKDDAYNQMVNEVITTQKQQADVDARTKEALDPKNIAAQQQATKKMTQQVNELVSGANFLFPKANKGVNDIEQFQKYTDASMGGIKAQSDITQRANTSNIMRDAQTQRNAQAYMDQEATIADQLARKEELQNEIQLKNDQQQARQSALKNQFNTSAKGVIYNTLGNIVENTARGIRGNVATLAVLSKQQQRDFNVFKKDIQNAFNPY